MGRKYFLQIIKGGSKVCSNPNGKSVGNVQARIADKIETEQLLRKYKHLQITIRCPWKRQQGLDFATFLKWVISVKFEIAI